MAKKFRKIGVLTSGGDAPGMNAAIRAIARSAIDDGLEVVGIKGGYSGLIRNELIDLSARSVSNIVYTGGSFLFTDRCPEFKTPEGIAKAIETCKKNEIDAIVAIGGDGTFRGATDLTNHGIPTIGVTGTIDNDITATDYAVGFDTAMNTALNAIDCIHDTIESHARCMVVEVMGRNCGQIALNVGIAAGATAVVIPEIKFDLEACIEKILKMKENGKRSHIIVVAEGVFNPDGTHFSESLVKIIEERTGIETKFDRLGYIVRGGKPTLRDRLAASRMGDLAVKLLLAGESNKVICEINSQIVPVDINYALVLDRMYKNTLKPGQLDKFSEEEIAAMKARIDERTQGLLALYTVENKINL